MVVVIVPTFTHGEKSKPEGIFAVLAGLIAAVAKHVAERVDGEGGVIENHRADEKSPDQSDPSANQVDANSGGDGRNPMVLIEEDEFGKLGQILHRLLVVLFVFIRENPADVRPVKAFELGGMQIFLGVGMFMVMPVMRGPPERAFLCGSAADEGEDELEEATGLVAAMREVAMESSRDAEFTDEEHDDAEGKGFPSDSNPNGG